MNAGELVKVIKLSGAKVLNESEFMELKEGTNEFERTLKFTALFADYEIEWWNNICYLISDEMQIPFRFATSDNCWPNKYKTNLNLLNDGNKVAIIPTEEYGEIK